MFAVSIYGSFGRGAISLLRDLSRRDRADRLPPRLADDSTWAAHQLAPYARMRIALTARLGLVRALRHAACTGAAAQAAVAEHAGQPVPVVPPPASAPAPRQ